MEHESGVDQTLSSAYKHCFDVCAYGAKGDGVSEDTAAIQAAINDAERRGGGIVLLPAGRIFKTTYTLFYGSNVHFSGYGAEIRFEPPQKDATAFVPRSYLGTAETKNVGFAGFKLTTLADKGNGIGTPKAEKVRIKDGIALIENGDNILVVNNR